MNWPMEWKCTHEPSDSDRKGANIPEKKWEGELDCNLVALTYWRVVAKYIEDLKQNIEDGIGLVLWGPYRSGKTSLACIVGKEVLRHYGSVWFSDASALMDAWVGRAETPDGGSVKTAMMNRHLLIIDDLGREQGKEYTKGVVDAIVRFRVERGRSVIITSNLDMAEMGRMYGPKFVAVAKSALLPVRVEGKDWGIEEQERLRLRFESAMKPGGADGESK